MVPTRAAAPSGDDRVALAACVVRSLVLVAQLDGLAGAAAKPAHDQLVVAAHQGKTGIVVVQALLHRYPIDDITRPMWDAILGGTWADIDTFVGSMTWQRATAAMALLGVDRLGVARDWVWEATLDQVLAAVKMFDSAVALTVVGADAPQRALVKTLLREHPALRVGEAWAATSALS